MEDKCPECDTSLTTRTIKKELGLGSIDYPVARVCPKCNWNRDLTGAGDIVSKPVSISGEIKKEAEKPAVTPQRTQPKTELSSSGINKIITITLTILVLVGIVWTFYLAEPEQKAEVPKQTPTPGITETPATPVTTGTPIPVVTEVTPTGKKISVKLSYYRGFMPVIRNIKLGDEIVWENYEAETVTLVSNDGLFDAQLLAYGKQHRYIFKKLGTYSFYLKGNKNLNGTIVVEP